MKKALIVGIDEYTYAPDLMGCVNDALAIAELLERNEDGSKNFDCISLLAPDDQIDCLRLRKAIHDLFMSPTDCALFYFSGHGTENQLGGYVATQETQRYADGVSMAEILTLANSSPAKEVTIILDCCHSGAFGQVPAITGNDLALLREGVGVLTASRSSESALEQDGRGLFTSILCDALKGSAADVMGNITLSSIYAFADQALGAWEQRPLLKAHLSRFSPLRTTAPRTNGNGLKPLFWLKEGFASPDAVFPLDPEYEPSLEAIKEFANPDWKNEHPELKNDPEKVEIWNTILQPLRNAGLIEALHKPSLFWAAMALTGCRLTMMGKHYWRLVKEGKI